MAKITFFDLFAGIGGFRLALEGLGWRCVGWCENDRFCQETYRANFDCGGEFFWADARTLPTDAMPDFDVLCAGFPCQPFSVAGRRRGFEDARGTLFFDIARVLDGKGPGAFLLENVKGLTMGPMRRCFNRMVQILHGLGYRVFWRVLNSKDFGVPQNRERVFVVGFRDGGALDRAFVWPRPRPLTVRLADVFEPDPDPRYDLSPKMVACLVRHLDRSRRAGRGFGFTSLRASGGTDIRKRPTVFVGQTNPHFGGEERRFRASGVARSLKAEWSHQQQPWVLQVKRYRKGGNHEVRGYASVSPTLTKQLGTGGHNVPSVFIGELAERVRLRRLTPRECARLQGFPDSFRIVVSDTQAYRQFGNAVTVPVVRAVGKAMEGWLRG